MKTHTIRVVVVVLTVLMSAVVVASGAGAHAPRRSATESEGLDRLAIGVAFDKESRGLVARDAAYGLDEERVLEARHYYGFASLELLPWMTVESGAGATEVKPFPTAGYGDREFMWMAGARASFWQYAIEAPEIARCMLSIDGSFSYWEHEGDDEVWPIEWNEQRADLRLCAEFPVDSLRLDRSDYPYSAIFFAGPVYSDIDADLDDGLGGAASETMDEDRKTGIAFGVSVMIAPTLSVGYEARTFDETSHNINAAIRF